MKLNPRTPKYFLISEHICGCNPWVSFRSVRNSHHITQHRTRRCLSNTHFHFDGGCSGNCGGCSGKYLTGFLYLGLLCLGPESISCRCWISLSSIGSESVIVRGVEPGDGSAGRLEVFSSLAISGSVWTQKPDAVGQPKGRQPNSSRLDWRVL